MKLRTENQAHQVEIELGGESTTVTVQPLTATDIQRLLKKHTKIKYKGGMKEEEIDELALRNERFLKTLIDWEGITDVNNEPLTCDEDNKLKLVEHSPEFVLAVFEATDNIHRTLNQEEAEIQKN